jgi:hypothetical protein
MLQNRNLFDPIFYMMRQQMKRTLNGHTTLPIDNDCCTCLDQNARTVLTKEKNKLKYIDGYGVEEKNLDDHLFRIELIYNRNRLQEVKGTCLPDGPTATVLLVYEKSSLKEIIPSPRKTWDTDQEDVIELGEEELI